MYSQHSLQYVKLHSLSITTAEISSQIDAPEGTTTRPINTKTHEYDTAFEAEKRASQNIVNCLSHTHTSTEQ